MGTLCRFDTRASFTDGLLFSQVNDVIGVEGALCLADALAEGDHGNNVENAIDNKDLTQKYYNGLNGAEYHQNA